MSLNRWPRVVAGIFGGLAFGLGVTAMFTADVELGPVALMAIGVVFIVAALAGRLPISLRLGNAEIIWLLEESQRAKAVGDEESARTLEDLALERFSNVTIHVPLSPEQYERLGLSALRQAVPDGAIDEQLGTTGIRRLARLDARVARRGISIGVDFRSGLNFSPERVAKFIDLVSSFPASEIQAVLFIVNADRDDDRLRAKSAQLAETLIIPVEVIGWRPGDPPDEIRAALDRLANQLGGW